MFIYIIYITLMNYKLGDNNTLNEIDIKEHSYHYLVKLTNTNDLLFKNIKADKKSYKIF